MAARHKRTASSRRYVQPSLWNDIKFRVSSLPIFNPLSEFPMSTSSRRNILIRSVATIVGDVAVGVAVVSACAWLIETAALGIFLSFLLWLIGALLALALSQYVVHPVVELALADDKLDRGLVALASLASQIDLSAASAWMQDAWSHRNQWLRSKPV